MKQRHNRGECWCGIDHGREHRRLQEALGSLERFRDTPAHVERIYAERAEAIRQAFHAGATVSAIANVLGLPRTVVYRALSNGTKGES